MRMFYWIGLALLTTASFLGWTFPRSLHLVKAALALVGAGCFLVDLA